jgi:hypothetical protein
MAARHPVSTRYVIPTGLVSSPAVRIRVLCYRPPRRGNHKTTEVECRDAAHPDWERDNYRPVCRLLNGVPHRTAIIHYLSLSPSVRSLCSNEVGCHRPPKTMDKYSQLFASLDCVRANGCLTLNPGIRLNFTAKLVRVFDRFRPIFGLSFERW